jgi:hypothetical protein
MSPRGRFSIALPKPEPPSRRRRLLLAVLLVLAVIALARLMLRVAQVPSERVHEERVIRVR